MKETVDSLLREDGLLHTITSDNGKEFDPTTRPEPDLKSGPEERPIGGLGIHLIRTIMDTVSYKRQSGKNLLIMTKNI